MMKLFAVLLGGYAERCNLELHDIVFTVGETLPDKYPELIQKWFGVQKRLHIDSSIELRFVDNHEIILSKTKPSNSDKKLFFVNFGGYRENYFGEIHESAFYIAASKTEALDRAKEHLALSLIEPHCDDNLSIDDIQTIDLIDQYYLTCIPTTTSTPLNIETYYRSLSPPQILENTASLA